MLNAAELKTQVRSKVANNFPAIERDQANKRRGRHVFREKADRAICEDGLHATGVERIHLAVVGAVHCALTDDRCVAGPTGVVLQAGRVGTVDAEAVIDVSPAPAIRCEVSAEGNIANARILSALAADVLARTSGILGDHHRIGGPIGDIANATATWSATHSTMASFVFIDGRPAITIKALRTALMEP